MKYAISYINPLDGDITYEHPSEEYARFEEPPCITRKIQADETV